MRSSPLTATLSSYEDVDRLATASARRSRAGLEIAERQFRAGSIDDARQTLAAAWAQADANLSWCPLWPRRHDVAYQDLQRSMSDMGRLSEFIVTGKNALGYSPAWIPVHYRASLAPKTNFEQTSDMAEEYVGWAEDKVDLARGQSRLVDDNYIRMQDRYRQIIDEYDAKLVELCEGDDGGLDLARCDHGAVAEQVSAVDQAQLRLLRVVEQMNVLNRRGIDLEVEARARVAGLITHTATLMNPETSAKYSSLMDQQKEISTGWKVVKGIAGVLMGMTTGGRAGSAFGPEAPSPEASSAAWAPDST